MDTKLKALRQEQKLSAEYLASKANIALRTYHYYESGTRRPGVDAAMDLAKALGTTVEDLFGT